MGKLVVSESTNMGIGLWTSICVAFCSIFGRSSRALNAKQNSLVSFAVGNINRKLLQYPNYEAVDLEVKTYGKSTMMITVSVLLETKQDAPAPQLSVSVSPTGEAKIQKLDDKKQETKRVNFSVGSSVVVSRDLFISGLSTIKKGTPGVITEITKNGNSINYSVEFDLPNYGKKIVQVDENAIA